MSDDRSTNRAGDAVDSAAEPAVELAHDELQTTFDYQVQRLAEIDNKAIEILKANLLLIGIVVTGGSVLIQTDIDVAALLNAFTLHRRTAVVDVNGRGRRHVHCLEPPGWT